MNTKPEDQKHLEQHPDQPWKVAHYHQNPRHNTTAWYTNRADAEHDARGITDDSDQPGISYVENLKTGVWGKRYWNKKKIEWHK